MNAPLAKEQIALLMADSLTYRSPAVDGMEGAFAAPEPSTFWGKLARAIRSIADLPRRRAVVHELASLSDRELADIGLSRNQVGKVFDPAFQALRSRL